MDQYLYIPFLGGWTSINPSYFDVHQGFDGFWWVLTHPLISLGFMGHEGFYHGPMAPSNIFWLDPDLGEVNHQDIGWLVSDTLATLDQVPPSCRSGKFFDFSRASWYYNSYIYIYIYVIYIYIYMMYIYIYICTDISIIWGSLDLDSDLDGDMLLFGRFWLFQFVSWRSPLDPTVNCNIATAHGLHSATSGRQRTRKGSRERHLGYRLKKIIAMGCFYDFFNPISNISNDMLVR